jgi:YVTN family beta-propeller protein
MRPRAGVLVLVLLMPVGAHTETAEPPLVLESKILLGEVRGRIDHLGFDSKRQRLYVAELGNDSLGVVDLGAGKVVRRIAGLSEPQGVAYEPMTDTVYVANAGDGSVRILRGEDQVPVERIDLGDDADNVRIDAPRKRVLVGYGKGALAIIDPAMRVKTAEIRLAGHPESFQIDDTQVFINVPDDGAISMVDLRSGAARTLRTGPLRANFPMAIDREAHRVLVAFRSPPTLLALASGDGQTLAKIETCGDADDVFVDAKRRRIYVSCGEGAIDVIEPQESGYRHAAKIATMPGARTALFVPERDRLYLAVRAAAGEPAAIWVFRPTP